MIPRNPFLEGAKAAIPVWLAFIPYSFALGVAAKSQGLQLAEIVLMSLLVYAGPAQFAALEPLAAGKPVLQILLTTFLINLRFLVMSAVLAPYLRPARRRVLLPSSHLISASSFIVSLVSFQRGEGPPHAPSSEEVGRDDQRCIRYFLGVALTSFLVWVVGSGTGYWVALHVPASLGEGLKFMLPGYFACMLVKELRRWTPALICAVSFLVAAPAALLYADWGWLGAALLIATLGWGIEQRTRGG